MNGNTNEINGKTNYKKRLKQNEHIAVFSTRAVNRAFTIIDSRSDCGTRKNTWRKYCKIGIAQYLYVQTSHHIVFI